MAHIEYSLETLEDFIDIGNEWAKELYNEKKAYLENLYGNLVDCKNILNLSNKNIVGILDLKKYDEFINYKKIYSINCSNNQISKIINIPNSLKYLNCSNNQIKSLLNLPDLMTKIKCKFNPLKKLYYPLKIKPKKWSRELTHLKLKYFFENCFDELPNDLIYLEIPFSKELNIFFNDIPTKIKKILHITEYISQDNINSINTIINHIIINGDNCDINLDNLSNNIKYLDLPPNYTNTIDNLPNSIEYINFLNYDEYYSQCGNYREKLFDKTIDNLPSKLIYLNLSGSWDFNQSLNNLPNNLEILEMANLLNYDKKINTLPTELKKLVFKTHYNYILDNIIKLLPSKLEYLELKGKFIDPINILSSNLKKIKLHINCPSHIKIDFLPNTVEEFTINVSKKYNSFYDFMEFKKNSFNFDLNKYILSEYIPSEYILEYKKSNMLKIEFNKKNISINKKINFNGNFISIVDLNKFLKNEGFNIEDEKIKRQFKNYKKVNKYENIMCNNILYCESELKLNSNNKYHVETNMNINDIIDDKIKRALIKSLIIELNKNFDDYIFYNTISNKGKEILEKYEFEALINAYEYDKNPSFPTYHRLNFKPKKIKVYKEENILECKSKLKINSNNKYEVETIINVNNDINNKIKRALVNSIINRLNQNNVLNKNFGDYAFVYENK
jgi:hypothetical protein